MLTLSQCRLPGSAGYGVELPRQLPGSSPEGSWTRRHGTTAAKSPASSTGWLLVTPLAGERAAGRVAPGLIAGQDPVTAQVAPVTERLSALERRPVL